jgi:hypothetical protein
VAAAEEAPLLATHPLAPAPSTGPTVSGGGVRGDRAAEVLFRRPERSARRRRRRRRPPLGWLPRARSQGCVDPAILLHAMVNLTLIPSLTVASPVVVLYVKSVVDIDDMLHM